MKNFCHLRIANDLVLQSTDTNELERLFEEPNSADWKIDCD